MKDILSFIEKLINQKIFLLIVGILLIVLSATTGIKTDKIIIPIDNYGRVILLILGVFLIALTLINIKSGKINFTVQKIKPLFTDKPVKITASKKNKYKIRNDFIFWKKCSIMLWVYVAPKNTGLRNSTSNKYLIAYHTGAAEPNNIHTPFFNQFTIRHNSKDEEWNIAISNNSADYVPKVFLKDNLLEGWYHFMLTWNKEKDILHFSIHNIKGKLQTEDYFPDRFKNWIEKNNNSGKATVGAFQSSYEGHYCETELFNLTILNSCIKTESNDFKNHIAQKPIY